MVEDTGPPTRHGRSAQNNTAPAAITCGIGPQAVVATRRRIRQWAAARVFEHPAPSIIPTYRNPGKAPATPNFPVPTHPSTPPAAGHAPTSTTFAVQT
ncbi:hypothetical protein [Nocardia altamirensis]|uniref:hypothetical protein n=1 Tax=Nocardia altamirensis TaxID=472158 RepID=UPI00114CEBEA|nr:hypothetical protein [Nocardia altamirensis]